MGCGRHNMPDIQKLSKDLLREYIGLPRMAEVDEQPASSSTTIGIQPVSGSRTPIGIHEQGISKEIDEFGFRKLLLNIDRNLMENDILALKYLCLDKNIGLSHGELENVNRGLDLLEKLERKRLLSKSKLEVLIELLGLIERYDLKLKVEQCLDLQQKMKGIQAKKISSYRALILDFASDIGRKELESLKPILKPHIPAMKIERLNKPIELMIELEKLRVISPQKINFLFQIANYLQSDDLVHKLEEFKDISIQPKSHGDSESMSPVTGFSTIDGPQPENHGDTEPATQGVSVQPENHKDTEETRSCLKKCWCMTKWIFLIGGILLGATFGLMAILLKNGLGKNISEITAEISGALTFIGFIMTIYDKCNASNCCPRNREETQSQPRPFTGTYMYSRVRNDMKITMNIPVE
ncbi:uncharacterized protein LOC117107600 isoform X2 [Anneissia japonica]|uniref:uncharacterized protein LOC117107600 isoform X2 n=1 Tax=Anneissia japonica TaxID=1529436 RepID=UPI001425B444|nr:uncharacterized protein LOC117107600 isoform X2 [Anneissia japonica]